MSNGIGAFPPRRRNGTRRAMFADMSPMCSSSLLILSTVMTNRRSLATGWWRARIFRHSSSVSTSVSSIFLSL